jgi:hypothetical protein
MSQRAGEFALGVERTCDQEIQPDGRIRIGSWLRILSFRNRCPEPRNCADRRAERAQACGRCLNSFAVSNAHPGHARRRRDLTVHAGAPNMTTRIDFSKEQERGGAAENQKRLAGRTEKARRSGLDACFYRRAIVVCRNFLRAQQDVGDLWRLTHRHVYALQRTSTLLGALVASNALAIQTQ